MENLFDTFLTFVLLYKYVGLFIISYIAAFIFPLPSGTALAAAGAFASQGYLNFSLVLSIALAGNIAGDATGYIIARQYGERLLAQAGFSHALRSKNYLFIHKHLEIFPYPIIFFSRFFTQVNALVNILAGIGKMSWKKFFLFEVFGEIAFVFFYGYAGFVRSGKKILALFRMESWLLCCSALLSLRRACCCCARWGSRGVFL